MHDQRPILLPDTDQRGSAGQCFVDPPIRRRIALPQRFLCPVQYDALFVDDLQDVDPGVLEDTGEQVGESGGSPVAGESHRVRQVVLKHAGNRLHPLRFVLDHRLEYQRHCLGFFHLALFDDALWAKYQLGSLTKGKAKTNTWIKTSPAADADPKSVEDAKGVYSPADTSITVLQERGAVFLACHNAIWELTGHLHAIGHNPDKVSHAQMAAEFTNHLIPGAVLTPGIVATLVELENAGYRYAG